MSACDMAWRKSVSSGLFKTALVVHMQTVWRSANPTGLSETSSAQGQATECGAWQ